VWTHPVLVLKVALEDRRHYAAGVGAASRRTLSDFENRPRYSSPLAALPVESTDGNNGSKARGTRDDREWGRTNGMILNDVIVTNENVEGTQEAVRYRRQVLVAQCWKTSDLDSQVSVDSWRKVVSAVSRDFMAALYQSRSEFLVVSFYPTISTADTSGSHKRYF